MRAHRAEFRFYEELNDFLAPGRRKVSFPYDFNGAPAIKDAIEALGVPHTEVDMILANGHSVGFEYALQPGDRIAVYPVFEALDISPIIRLRPAPLREVRFVLDVHLGKLAKFLRLLGFDVGYQTGATDDAIIRQARRERRIILTRDRGILKDGRVTHGYWVRNTHPPEQCREVLRRFDLARAIAPFTRCLECNGRLTERPRSEVGARVPPRVAARCREFRACDRCGRLYWKGTHYAALRTRIEELTHDDA